MHLLLQGRTSLETSLHSYRLLYSESDNTNWVPRLTKCLKSRELSMVHFGHKDVLFLLLLLLLLYLLFVCLFVCLPFIFCFLFVKFFFSFCSYFSIIKIDDSLANIPSFVRKVQECNICSTCTRQPKRILISSHAIGKASPRVIKLWNLVE